MYLLFFMLWQKGRDLTQSYYKSIYTHKKTQKALWQHKNATKNFDYTTIADRLWTVSWSNEILAARWSQYNEIKLEMHPKYRVQWVLIWY